MILVRVSDDIVHGEEDRLVRTEVADLDAGTIPDARLSLYRHVGHRPPTLDLVERYNREALAFAEERGMRSLQTYCYLGLGKLYRRMGRPDAARADLATAVAMLKEMGMAFW